MSYILTTYLPCFLLALAVAALVYAVVRPRPTTPFDKPTDFTRFWDNLDKFLMVGLFLVVMSIGAVMMVRKADPGSLAWVQNLAGQLISGLTILLGVNRFSQQRKNPASDSAGSETQVVTKDANVKVSS